MSKQIKKILFIITQPHYGGAQKYVQELAINLPKDQFKVYIATGHSGHKKDKNISHSSIDNKLIGELWLQELDKAGIETIRLTHVQRALSCKHDLLSCKELYGLYKKIQPNVIHLNSSKVGATGSVVAFLYNVFRNKSAKAKVIYTVHGFILNEPLEWWRKVYYWIAECVSAKLKDEIICVSENDKKSLLKYKIIKKNKISVISVGIDFDKLKFIEKQTARLKITDKSDIIIGTIAGLYKTKGIRYLIYAAKEVLQKKDNLQFIVFGSGPQNQYLRELIEKIGIENKFSIIQVNQKAAEYLKAFDIFILPSVKEGLPYTLIEARYAELPIIATRVGGIPEIIENGKTGLLIEPTKPKILANKIIELIEDKNLREKLSNDTRKNLNKFSLQKMLEKTLEHY